MFIKLIIAFGLFCVLTHLQQFDINICLWYTNRQSKGMIEMPINEHGMNSDYVSYFPIEEYVAKIDLTPELLDHLELTSNEFDKYMNKLGEYNREHIVEYWIYLLYRELESSHHIENREFCAKSIVENGVFFEHMAINHKRIHELHNFVTSGYMEPTFNYRNVPVNVSHINSDGTEDIFWRGVNPEDVSRFMRDLIKVYKQNKIALLYSNPFLVSSLMHLLFVRIHPYTDGNGRTSRVIHNIKFTEAINRLYGMKLKISPLNLSESILLNKITYNKRINQIYFDLDHDTNDAINAWFDFILDMADEQIYRASNMLKKIPRRFLISQEEALNGSKGLGKVLKGHSGK